MNNNKAANNENGGSIGRIYIIMQTPPATEHSGQHIIPNLIPKIY